MFGCIIILVVLLCKKFHIKYFTVLIDSLNLEYIIIS